MAKPIAIAIIMAIVERAKYISVGGSTATGGGDADGAASSTANDVTACEGQYDLLPSNVA